MRKEKERLYKIEVEKRKKRNKKYMRAQQLVTENELDTNFDYETDDEHEQEILNKGKEFLNTCDFGDSYRWEVDPMSMQYCELRRLS